jgi:hypothetical protein
MRGIAFFQHSRDDQVLIMRAWGAVALARLLLTILPWSSAWRVGRWRVRGRTRDATTERLRWAVVAASRYVPRATCLVQALALHGLLARRGRESHVRLGVRTGERFAAHAWLEVDGTVVLGDALREGYAALEL